jgi:hypothetical protein
MPQPPQQWLAPTRHPSTFNLHCIAGAGSPIHILGEVSTSSAVLLVYYSFIMGRLKMVYPYFTFFDDTPSSDVNLGVEHHHGDERQVQGGISALYLFDDSPSCDVYLGVEHHHDDERQVEGADGRIELHTKLPNDKNLG